MINRTGRRRTKQKRIAPKLPIAEIATASYPFPSRRRVWAGRTERAVSSSGAPKTVVAKVKK
jgi:hypothetical protein